MLMLFTVVKVRDILVRMIDVGERQVKTDAFVGSLGNSWRGACVTKIPTHLNSSLILSHDPSASLTTTFHF